MDSEKELTQTFEQLKEDLMKHHESVYDDEVEVHSLRRKLRNQEQKMKHEQYMRRRYPSVNEAYKQYQMLLKLTKSHK
tara:strand:+ start:1143 stop:1376 length:234 start_codon:yes stop_codon:yes gene_type:complete